MGSKLWSQVLGAFLLAALSVLLGIILLANYDRKTKRGMRSTGALLSKVARDDLEAMSIADTFQRATIALAESDLVGRYLAGPSRKRASLSIGHALYVDGHVAFGLDAGGFNRHTFLCGQS